MTYIEMLRVRRRLIVFASIVALFALLVFVPHLTGHGIVRYGSDGAAVGWNIGDGSHGDADSGDFARMVAQLRIPFGALLGTAAIFALAFSLFVARSLNVCYPALDSAFTKPIGRERLALAIFGIDAIAIAIAFTIALLLACAAVASLGLFGHLVFDAATPLEAVCAIGIPLMFYGFTQGATSWYRGIASAYGPIAATLFLILAPVSRTPFGWIVDGLIAIVRFFDPIYYLGSLFTIASSGVVSADAFAQLLQATGIVWAIALVGCVVALFSWKRLEV